MNDKVGFARFFYCEKQGIGCHVSAAESSTVTQIRSFAEPLIEEKGLELVEIQFRREQHGWVLRFFIDREEGVSLDDCTNVSREISAYLEVEDLIDHAYHLEVSSPGAERPLKSKRDYQRFVGKKARIKLSEPMKQYKEQKTFVGLLQGIKENTLLLDCDNNTVELDIGNISKARLTL